MRMGDQNMAYGFTGLKCCAYRFQMRHIQWAGIQYRHGAIADDKAARACIGERAGIRAGHAPHQWRVFGICHILVLNHGQIQS